MLGWTLVKSWKVSCGCAAEYPCNSVIEVRAQQSVAVLAHVTIFQASPYDRQQHASLLLLVWSHVKAMRMSARCCTNSRLVECFLEAMKLQGVTFVWSAKHPSGLRP